jgi:hypothetical protein
VSPDEPGGETNHRDKTHRKDSNERKRSESATAGGCLGIADVVLLGFSRRAAGVREEVPDPATPPGLNPSARRGPRDRCRSRGRATSPCPSRAGLGGFRSGSFCAGTIQLLSGVRPLVFPLARGLRGPASGSCWNSRKPAALTGVPCCPSEERPLPSGQLRGPAPPRRRLPAHGPRRPAKGAVSGPTRSAAHDPRRNRLLDLRP